MCGIEFLLGGWTPAILSRPLAAGTLRRATTLPAPPEPNCTAGATPVAHRKARAVDHAAQRCQRETGTAGDKRARRRSGDQGRDRQQLQDKDQAWRTAGTKEKGAVPFIY
ncbi:hypothetical protein IM543_17770 [Massilia sp. UMI-21]|nr:hypothetical protein IM543_17770 [Massilia sp. UMI-21]